METAAAARRQVRAERAAVLLYDPASDTLWRPPAGMREERRESAAAGLVSFVARTGCGCGSSGSATIRAGTRKPTTREGMPAIACWR